MRKYQKQFKMLKPAMKGQEGQLCAQEGPEKFEQTVSKKIKKTSKQMKQKLNQKNQPLLYYLGKRIATLLHHLHW